MMVWLHMAAMCSLLCLPPGLLTQGNEHRGRLWHQGQHRHFQQAIGDLQGGKGGVGAAFWVTKQRDECIGLYGLREEGAERHM